MKPIIYLTLVMLFASTSLSAQNDHVHPRGILSQREVREIRAKVRLKPFSGWLKKMESSTLQAEGNATADDPYATAYLALKQAQMFVVTGEVKWAEKCYQSLQPVIDDPVYFNDPVSRGLTRATQLFIAAQCYDFCYEAWNGSQRKAVNEKLFQTLLSVNSNMGFSANYALESNWNGVRWGSALLAALVYDDLEDAYDRNPALPFIWDIQRRLKDHIDRNVFPGGWSAESLSYHGYNWSFIAPALVALQNSSGNPVFNLENYAPHVLNSLRAWSAATVSIEHPEGRGIQPDLSDDDPQASYLLTAFGLRLYPAEQVPAIKWMHDYLLDLKRIKDDKGYLFYSVCWYPENIPAQNPEAQGWLTFTDYSYGVSVWRNRYRDENDAVVAFNAPLKRVSGHKGPDNLTFRVIGGGNIWVTGAGRTGEIAGQTNLFAARPSDQENEPAEPVESRFFKSGVHDGSYTAYAEKGCMGVTNHKRKIEVDFVSAHSFRVIISDESDNGRIWRLNTPGFNQVEVNGNTVIVTAPDGSEMKISAPPVQVSGEISISEVRYGGSTTQNNRGIGWGEQYWNYNKAIDFPCEGNIDVQLELKLMNNKKK